jgi:hypothetical protein
MKSISDCIDKAAFSKFVIESEVAGIFKREEGRGYVQIICIKILLNSQFGCYAYRCRWRECARY